MADQGVHPARCGFVEVVSKTKHSKTEHPEIENEAPKTRKRNTQIWKLL